MFQLPINAVLPELIKALDKHDAIVLEAPPGAGKTTAVPIALLEASWRKGKKILLLEPRRVAARAAAQRLAALLQEKPGDRVGYRIRSETRVGPNSQIEVVTEGVLTRMLQSDPELSGVAAVIFDEFHERSIHSDLGLALCLQAREVFREKDAALKLIVMSATIKGSEISSLLGNAPIISSQGKSYPVDIHYGDFIKIGESPLPKMAECIPDILKKHQGDALVFLPGQREIQTLQKQLSHKLDTQTQIFPLYGNLKFDEQQRALQPLPQGRKVVLATDIAETSLTIQGVNIVIDSGLARKAKFDPKTGLSRLHTERISKASATQRAGRAGRLGPGVCYRMWHVDQHDQLGDYDKAEILQADLAPLMLELLRWGVSDPSELHWIDPPPSSTTKQALSLLELLGIVQNNQLTEHGAQVAELPLHPRLAHMLIKAVDLESTASAANIAALVSEKTPPLAQGSNLQHALSILSGKIAPGREHKTWKERCLQQVKRYQSLVWQDDKHLTSDPEKNNAVLLAMAYPDRIAMRRDKARHNYLLSNGRSASLKSSDPLAGQNFLAVCEVGGTSGQADDRIYSALPLSQDALNDHLSSLCQPYDHVAWQEGRLVAERQLRLGALILKRSNLDEIDGDRRRNACIEAIKHSKLQLLPWTQELRQWQRRVALLAEHCPETHWPDLSDNALLENTDWIAPHLMTVRKRADFKHLDLKSILAMQLPWPLPQQLDELAPRAFKVPSGSSIAIDYTQYPPVLEVKLQEMFGCKHSPRIANSRVALVVHLLSPARRPLQITQDLEHFWNSSYQEVKKEMKGRYPKHPWPDDPWNAPATRHTKKRM